MACGTLVATDGPDGTCVVERDGLFGRRSMRLPTCAADIDNWIRSGSYVQDAFPGLSAKEREFLLTGITPADWEELPEEDE